MTVGVFSFGTSLAVWYAIKRAMGIRVSSEHELIGLDISEMGIMAYPESIAIESRVAPREKKPVPAEL